MNNKPFRGSPFQAFWRSAVLTVLAVILIVIGYFTASFFLGSF